MTENPNPGSGFPPPAYPPPGPARPTGPVGPRLRWIFLSWVLFLVLLFAGVGGFVGGIFSSINDAAPTTTFGSGQTVSVELDDKDRPVIYASTDQPADVRCRVGDDRGSQLRLTRPAKSEIINVNGMRWETLFTVSVPQAGTYQVTCQGDGVTFGVGREFTAGAAKMVGGAFALVVLPFIGFVIALVVTIVVLVRRSAARRGMAHP